MSELDMVSTTDEYIETNTDRKIVGERETPLFAAIEKESWEDAEQRLEIAPSDALNWVMRESNKNDDKKKENGTAWRRLPLHEACLRNAPEDIITALLVAHPDGAKEKDLLGRLPIHLSCMHNGSSKVIYKLLLAYPQSAEVEDSFQKTPTDCVVGCANSELVEIIELLVKKPSYYASRASELRITKKPNKPTEQNRPLEQSTIATTQEIKHSNQVPKERIINGSLLKSLEEELNNVKTQSEERRKKLEISATKEMALERRLSDKEKELSDTRAHFYTKQKQILEERDQTEATLLSEQETLNELLEASVKRVKDFEDKFTMLQGEMSKEQQDYNRRKQDLLEERDALKSAMHSSKLQMETGLNVQYKEMEEKLLNEKKQLAVELSKRAESRVAEKESANQELTKKNQALNIRLEQNDGTIQYLEQKLQNTEKQMKLFMATSKEKERSLVVSKQSAEVALVEEKEDLKKRLAALETELEETQIKFQDTEQKLITKQHNVFLKLTEEKNKVSSQFDSSLTTISSLEDRVATLESELESTKAQHKAKENLITNEQQRLVAYHEKEIRELSNKLTTEKDELVSKIENEKSLLVLELQASVTNGEALETNIENLLSKVSDLERQLKDKDEEDAVLLKMKHSELAVLLDEKKKLSEQFQSSESKVESLEKSVKELETQMALLIAERDENESNMREEWAAREAEMTREIGELEAKVAENGSMNLSLTEKNKLLSNELQASTTQANALEEEKKDLKEKVEHLRAEILRKETTETEMHVTKKTYESQLEEKDRELEERAKTNAYNEKAFDTALKLLNEKLAMGLLKESQLQEEKDSVLATLEVEKKALNAMHKHERDSLTTKFSKEKEALNMRVQELTKQGGSLEGNLVQLRSDIDKLETEKNLIEMNLKAEKDDLEKKLLEENENVLGQLDASLQREESLEESFRMMEERFAALQQEINTAKDEYRTKETDQIEKIIELRTKLGEVNKLNVKVTMVVKQKNAEIEALQKELESTSRRRDEEMTTSRREKETLENERDQLLEKVKELEETVSNLENTLMDTEAKFGEKLKSMNSQHAEMQGAIDRLMGKLEEMKEKMIDAEKSFSNGRRVYEEAISGYEVQLTEASDVNEALKKEVREGLGKLEQALSDGAQQRALLQIDLLDLKKKLETVEKSKSEILSTLNHQKASFVVERSQYRARIEVMAKKNHALQSESESLKRQYDVVKASMNEMAAANMKMVTVADSQEQLVTDAIGENRMLLDEVQLQTDELRNAYLKITQITSLEG